CGLAIGVPLSMSVTRLAASRLYGVTPGDPAALAGAAALMATAAMAGACLPARRAARPTRLRRSVRTEATLEMRSVHADQGKPQMNTDEHGLVLVMTSGRPPSRSLWWCGNCFELRHCGD